VPRARALEYVCLNAHHNIGAPRAAPWSRRPLLADSAGGGAEILGVDVSGEAAKWEREHHATLHTSAPPNVAAVPVDPRLARDLLNFDAVMNARLDAAHRGTPPLLRSC
jgi:hypothetical protein